MPVRSDHGTTMGSAPALAATSYRRCADREEKLLPPFESQRIAWFKMAAVTMPSRVIINRKASGRLRSSRLTVANKNRPVKPNVKI
jgi:hypothetical protein